MVEENSDGTPNVPKLETGLPSDNDDGYSGPHHEGSSQILSISSIKQNPNFLEDLLDGFTAATKSESQDGLTAGIKVENTGNEDTVGEHRRDERLQLLPESVPSTSFGVNSGSHVEDVVVKQEDNSIIGPHHESDRHSRNGSSSDQRSNVVLEKLNLVNASNLEAMSTLNCDLPNLVARIKVENTEDENILAGPNHESACHRPSISSSKWNPHVRLERIDLTWMDASNRTKSILSRDLPILLRQIKVENTEDENISAGPNREFARHGASTSSKWNPRVCLERIDLTLLDASNLGIKSTSSRGWPSLIRQIKVENMEDEIPVAGSSMDGRLQKSRKKKSSAFREGSQISLEEGKITEQNRSSKGSSMDGRLQKSRKKESSAVGKSSQTSLEGDQVNEKNRPSKDVSLDGTLHICLKKNSSPLERGSQISLEESGVNVKNTSSKGNLNRKKRVVSKFDFAKGAKVKPAKILPLPASLLDVTQLKPVGFKLQAECGKTQANKKMSSSLSNSLKRLSEEKLHCGEKQDLFMGFKSHLLTHSDERLFLCQQCPVHTKTKGYLEEHLLTHSEQIPCDQCLANSRTKKALKQHIQITHSDEMPFSCNQCSKCFKSKEVLKRNLLDQPDKRHFSCKLSPKCFKSQGDLNKDLEANSAKRPFLCQQCQKCYKSKKELKMHLRVHSDKRPFPCQQCRKCFKSSGQLQEHLQVHSDKRPFRCEQCQKCFKSKKCLKGHLRVHSDTRPFSCKECQKCFKSTGALQGHLQVHSDKRPFSCKQCQKCFKSKNKLKRHLQVHYDKKPFLCKQCQKYFKSKAYLKQHLRVHSDERPFPCEQCQKCFKSKKELKRHLQVHSDKRPFLCKQCQKGFKSTRGLQQHLEVHSDKKLFLCEQCQKCFKTKLVLKIHLRVHSDNRPFPCEQCPKRYKSKPVLKLHIQRVHSDTRPFSNKFNVLNCKHN